MAGAGAGGPLLQKGGAVLQNQEIEDALGKVLDQRLDRRGGRLREGVVGGILGLVTGQTIVTGDQDSRQSRVPSVLKASGPTTRGALERPSEGRFRTDEEVRQELEVRPTQRTGGQLRASKEGPLKIAQEETTNLPQLPPTTLSSRLEPLSEVEDRPGGLSNTQGAGGESALPSVQRRVPENVITTSTTRSIQGKSFKCTASSGIQQIDSNFLLYLIIFSCILTPSKF